MKQTCFPDPHEIPAPAGAEGWEDLYPPYLVFNRNHTELEDSTPWFQLSLQNPFVLYPVDVCFGIVRLAGTHGYANSLLAVPSTFGTAGELRILHGYLYASPKIRDAVEPKAAGERTSLFDQRMKFFTENWDDLWQRWVERNLEIANEIESITWPELTLIEEWETGGPQSRVLDKGYAPCGFSLLKTWNRFKCLAYERLYVHFDLLDVSFISYFLFRQYCFKAFPGIGEGEVASMLDGVERLTTEADLRLRELARYALELGLADLINRTVEPEAIIQSLGRTEAGRKWIGKWEESKPWFHVTNGNGMYHKDICWLENLSIPFDFLRSYISRLKKGEEVAIDREKRARDAAKLFAYYKGLLPSEDEKNAFTARWEEARQTSIAIEGHAYFNDHWIFSSLCRKLKELGTLLQRQGILQEEKDIFLLYDHELDHLLPQIISYWYIQKDPSSWLTPYHMLIEKRKAIIKILESCSPPPILIGRSARIAKGTLDPPEVVFRGISNESLEKMFQPFDDVKEIRGCGASPGVCEGTVRIIHDPVNGLGQIQNGDIVVIPFFSPGQMVALEKIKGLVTDWGGLISHPAIMAREYGIPAVVGTNIGTSLLRDGMKIKLDGTKGTIVILN